jgi:hypothetical protein
MQVADKSPKGKMKIGIVADGKFNNQSVNQSPEV